jgi:hypothetical protein
MLAEWLSVSYLVGFERFVSLFKTVLRSRSASYFFFFS